MHADLFDLLYPELFSAGAQQKDPGPVPWAGSQDRGGPSGNGDPVLLLLLSLIHIYYSLNKTRVGEICRAAEGLMVPEAGTKVCGCGKEERKKEDMEKMETVNTKLYVLTGFLGSGKTTALLKLDVYKRQASAWA